MKVLVTGATGMLGQAVMHRLQQERIPCVGVSTADFDLRDAGAVLQTVLRIQPDAIIHCAAWTAVDLAESEIRTCMDVNAMGTLNLVRAAQHMDAALLYVSTDYVFSGDGNTPHPVCEKPCSRSIYGLSKHQGEEAVRTLLARHFIVRTSWVFGPGGGNFVRTMLRLGQERSEVRVVSDQIGAPTFTVDLARLLTTMVQSRRYGTYHAANQGCCSFAEFAAAIMRRADLTCRVKPITTAEYPSAARRPLNSRLDMTCLDDAGFPRLPPWEDALDRYMALLRASGEI